MNTTNNNITESYVTFDVAKLLKEKGFAIRDYLGGVFLGTNFIDGNAKPVFGMGSSSKLPTTTLVISWIRENFGIHIYVECDCYGEFFYPKVSTASKETYEDLELRRKIMKARHNENLFEFKSQLEAENAAIGYILKEVI